MDKPPYRVRSMCEIAALPPNGFKVVSTFSGAGGSCLGFRMAGYQIVYANEFVEAARDTYRANNPATPLDDRDIRIVQPEEILERSGLGKDEIDVLEGSPPCASFSMAGNREKAWGQVKSYSDTAQRTDDLFFEYARLLRCLRPKVFVAENVGGLVRGTAKGYFIEILKALKACGYRVTARLLDAQWLGVPQARPRIIFVGVREDLGIEPAHPEPLAYRYSVRDALPWISAVKHTTVPNNWKTSDGPSPAIVANGGTITEAAYFSGAYVVAVEHANGFNGHAYLSPDRPASTIQASRPVNMLVEAETDISGYAIGDEWDRMKPGENSDKYFSLKRAPLDGPSQTILAIGGGHASKASVTHPVEKRKFTIAELKRICAFPDDFVVTGTYAQQWERLGRSVPPVMMCAVAETIRDRILCQLPTR